MIAFKDRPVNETYMRACLPALLLMGSLMVSGAWGQDASQPTPDGVLQKFEGTAAQTTPSFSVNDRWEVRWVGRRMLNISVLAADGTVVAGATTFRGALYLPKGGTYHLQIDCDAPPVMLPPPPPANNNNGGMTGFQTTLNGGLGNGSNNDSTASNQNDAAEFFSNCSNRAFSRQLL